jgi:hypothetical protein
MRTKGTSCIKELVASGAVSARKAVRIECMEAPVIGKSVVF